MRSVNFERWEFSGARNLFSRLQMKPGRYSQDYGLFSVDDLSYRGFTAAGSNIRCLFRMACCEFFGRFSKVMVAADI